MKKEQLLNLIDNILESKYSDMENYIMSLDKEEASIINDFCEIVLPHVKKNMMNVN